MPAALAWLGKDPRIQPPRVRATYPCTRALPVVTCTCPRRADQLSWPLLPSFRLHAYCYTSWVRSRRIRAEELQAEGLRAEELRIEGLRAEELRAEELRGYVWNWFAMHAGQRLQLVNFWLVAVAFLATAFVQSQISHVRIIAAGVALIGAVASLAFQRLDVRTRQLSQVAEDALRHFEDEWVAQGASELIMLAKRSHQARTNWTDSYRVIIQGLQLVVAAVFIAAFIYALVN